MTFDQITPTGIPKWLMGIRKQLLPKTYRPQLVRRVMIPKPEGGKRPLDITILF
jgi:RNA-directed DNA polymerase